MSMMRLMRMMRLMMRMMMNSIKCRCRDICGNLKMDSVRTTVCNDSLFYFETQQSKGYKYMLDIAIDIVCILPLFLSEINKQHKHK